MHGYLLDLGLTDYREASERQSTVHDARVANLCDDTLILTEHLPVYTLGRTWRAEHLGNAARFCRRPSIPIYETDRGGSVTYHGPGQVIGYPILHLRTYCHGPKAYMQMLEEVLIQVLRQFGLSGLRRPGMPGVWIQDRKIAAMGVRISSGVTRHGFALNVENDLAPFSEIVPCGLLGYGVTSIASEGRAGASVTAAKEAVVQAFQTVFGIALARERGEESLSNAAIMGSYRRDCAAMGDGYGRA